MPRAWVVFFHRRWVDAVLALILTLGLVCALNLALAVGQPFGGFFVWRNAAGVEPWQIEPSTPPDWPIIASGRLYYDDRLVALEGQPYDSAAAARLYAVAYAQSQPVHLTVRGSSGALREVAVSAESFQLGQLFDIKLPDLINGLGFWLLAVGVYNARRRDPVNRIFALLMGLLAGGLWLTLESLFPEADVPGYALRLAWCLFMPFTGALLYHLITLFPEPLSPFLQKLAPAVYLLSAGVAGVYTLSEGLWALGWHAVWVERLTALGLAATFVLFCGSVLLTLARLVRLLWKRRSEKRLRRQAALMMAGLAMALPYVLLVVLRTVFGGMQSYWWAYLDLRNLVLAFPLTHALVILRYQTLRGAQPMLVSLLILLSSALLASLGAWLVPFLAPRWSTGAGSTVFPTLFILALGVSLFWSTRQAWQGAFNRLLRWEQRSYAAVRQVGQQVVSQVDLARLPESIARALVDNLQIDCAAVWLWNEADQAFAPVGQAGRWSSAPAPRLTGVCRSTRPLRLDNERLPEALTPMRQISGLEVVAPLWVSGQLIGLLGVGKRTDEEIFDERDLEIIELIGQQAALFLFTALQVEQLRQVPRLVAEAQERQQFKIAQELHDTTQQYLGRLPFDLERSRAAIEADPAKAQAILAQSLVEVESAARTLRQIRNNLAPAQLDQSLEQPLRALAEQMRRRTGLKIDLEIAAEVDARLAANAPMRHALYRVVQQALDNTSAHAEACQVSIRLTTDAGRICFAVTDDGRGASEAERAEAAARGSFGLTSMATRITSLGGEFNFQSAPGQGTRLSGWLPVSAGG